MTPRDFETKAKAFCKDAGYLPGQIPVITREKNKIEWRHWIDYFEHIGMKRAASLMRGDCTSWTVPALSPMEFDSETGLAAVEAGDRKRAALREDRPGEERRMALARKLASRLGGSTSDEEATP